MASSGASCLIRHLECGLGLKDGSMGNARWGSTPQVTAAGPAYNPSVNLREKQGDGL